MNEQRERSVAMSLERQAQEIEIRVMAGHVDRNGNSSTNLQCAVTSAKKAGDAWRDSFRESSEDTRKRVTESFSEPIKSGRVSALPEPGSPRDAYHKDVAKRADRQAQQFFRAHNAPAVGLTSVDCLVKVGDLLFPDKEALRLGRALVSISRLKNVVGPSEEPEPYPGNFDDAGYPRTDDLIDGEPEVTCTCAKCGKEHADLPGLLACCALASCKSCGVTLADDESADGGHCEACLKVL